MILYKYLSSDLIKSIRSREVRFTPPDQFNDPFEALPSVSPPSLETLRRQSLPGENLDELMARASEYFPEVGPQMILTEVSAAYGALCLAETPHDPLLWAHYADGHRGFALGFDSTHEWFHQIRYKDPVLADIRKVEYQSERPVVQMVDEVDLEGIDRSDHARAMLFTKHTSWSYESEWRLVRLLADAPRTVTRDNGDLVHLFQYPPEAVSEVIVGVRTNNEHADMLLDALQEGQMSQAVVRKAKISTNSYFLDIGDSA